MRVLCIAGGGGHLEQMLACLDALEGHEIILAHYAFPNFRDFEDPRLREHVGIFRGGTSHMRLMIGTLLTVFQWLWLLARFRPHVIFSTGAELAIVPFWLGRLMFRARCIYLESAARDATRSGTGRFVYPVSNTFFVQRKTVLKQYGPKARYEGRLL